MRYDNVGDCKTSTWDNVKTCSVNIEIDEDINETVFFYYELHNYYQNHRRYVKSKSQDQLSGEDLSKSELDDCEPVLTYDDLGFNPTGTSLDEAAYPCGLIAKSYFNDTYTMTGPLGTVDIDDTDIAWKSDIDKKFEKIEGKPTWQDVTDEHFIVWMRVSGLPNFRKLWGRIRDGLPKGTLSLIHI